MGAINSNQSIIYLSIADGKICRRFQNPTDKTTTRVTKDGRTVHEEHYSGWEGIITDIYVRESDYGKDWNVCIQDGDEKAILQFKYSSGYASTFLKALPNVDLTKSVKISPKMTVENDKKKALIFLSQNGTPIKWYYTKDTPNGLPPMVQLKVKGQITWDDSDMMDFLENMVKEKLNPMPF